MTFIKVNNGAAEKVIRGKGQLHRKYRNCREFEENQTQGNESANTQHWAMQEKTLVKWWNGCDSEIQQKLK